MSFQLQVEFSGLCLYVLNPQADAAGNPVLDANGDPVIDRVAVLMPDCRRPTNLPVHVDRTPAEPHASYIRIDLADLADAPAGIPSGDLERGPRYELVHRFDRQVLDFGDDLKPRAMKTSPFVYPEILKVAPILELIPGLFDAAPPTTLLTRMILRGGDLVADEGDAQWRFPTHLNPTSSPHSGKFASFATWIREVQEESLTIRITDFAGNEEAKFKLRPTVSGGTVLLKIANLCAHNPLEWKELELRQVFTDDQDYKWLYRLLRPSDGSTYLQILGRREFPVPRRSGGRESASDDCIATKIVAAFPDPASDDAAATGHAAQGRERSEPA